MLSYNKAPSHQGVMCPFTLKTLKPLIFTLRVTYNVHVRSMCLIRVKVDYPDF